MPQKGQKSVTIHADILAKAESYFRKKRKIFMENRVRSVSAMIEDAIIVYIREE